MGLQRVDPAAPGFFKAFWGASSEQPSSGHFGAASSPVSQELGPRCLESILEELRPRPNVFLLKTTHARACPESMKNRFFIISRPALCAALGTSCESSPLGKGGQDTSRKHIIMQRTFSQGPRHHKYRSSHSPTESRGQSRLCGWPVSKAQKWTNAGGDSNAGVRAHEMAGT